MVRITEELIRKRSEHNEGIIGTLEELSLHQEDIEKIENINNWCRDLQILYLQANLISKIENLNKLKKLQYLNLAINNIEKIENLERCESLEKLDLTLNFIGDLESVCSLRNNTHFTNLNLTGNPCAEYKGYRDYVIAKLPQLEKLDSRDISRSERIKAQQRLSQIEVEIRRAQNKYRQFREDQKTRLAGNDSSNMNDDEFWKSSSEHAPETRVEITRRSRNSRRLDEPIEPKKNEVRLFAKDGRALNINQAKIPFTFNDEDPKEFVLTVQIYKYLDTELIDVDLQPIYARITIKNKIFQIVFPDEIFIDKSTCQRSTTSGQLVLRMPRINYEPSEHNKTEDRRISDSEEENKEKTKVSSKVDTCTKKNDFLEVQEPDRSMDFSKIVENNQNIMSSLENQEIPPLEFGY
ncbi:hypothetical protein WA026_012192 [Henosepilachna vigintioctopunctata]|uniref:U2A'/phosphoprotein 32 family A C-terminal domain-containing protein n=1 Tax=Henosepilachna vigintioctopunctata TaxID=420089 RepID=A0AAW1V573_9CUCU